MFLFCLDDNVCNFHKNDEFFSEGVKLSLSNYLISLPNLIIRWLNPTCNYFISKNNDSVYVTLQFSENFLFPLSFGMDQIIKLNWWIWSSGIFFLKGWEIVPRSVIVQNPKLVLSAPCLKKYEQCTNITYIVYVLIV